MRANLTGHDSHGVIRVPRYVAWERSGEFVKNQTAEVVTENDSFAVVDGRFGFGQSIGPEAVQVGMRKAAKSGAAVVALKSSGHLGRIGEWAEMAAEAGLVSVHFVNVAGSQLVAPFGGVDRRISTAPFSIGFPMRGAEPVILDFATSAVAEGKVLVAARGGKKLPEGSLIEPDGRLTADPHTLYGDYDDARAPDARNGKGAIRAFGEHKGSGLAFMCELLAGAFTGSGCAGPGAAAFCQRHAVLLHGAVVLRHRRGLYGGGAALHRILQELAPGECRRRSAGAGRARAPQQGGAPQERRPSPRRRLARHLRHGAGGRGRSGPLPGAATLGLPD